MNNSKFQKILKIQVNPLVSLSVVFIALMVFAQIPLWSQINELQVQNATLSNNQEILLQEMIFMKQQQLQNLSQGQTIVPPRMVPLPSQGNTPPNMAFSIPPSPEEVSRLKEQLKEELSDLQNGILPNPLKKHIRVNPKWGNDFI